MSLFPQAIGENRKTLHLALPMIAGQLGQMMMGWADTLMVGRLGVVALAACAFGTMVSHIFLVFGFGLISSVSVCASRAFGAGRKKESGEILITGSILAFLAGLAMVALVYAGLPWLHRLGQDPEVVKEARPFLILMAWSIVPALVTTAGKDYSESLMHPWLPFWILIGGVGLNVALNWVFIYGNLGFPAMGLAGAGVGTLLARCCVVLVLYAALAFRKVYRPYLVAHLPWAVFKRQFQTLLRIGGPSAFHLLGEVGLFAAAMVLMGIISVTALAAHQVALTFASTAFMVPLGLAFAVTVRVGHAIGAGELERIRPITVGAMTLGVSVMALFGVCFLVAGRPIAGWFVSDVAVVILVAKLLIFAAIFGVFDAAQVIGMGALRGMADVRVPMIFVYAAYWGIALPVGSALAFLATWGAVGVWAGLAIGLGCTAVAINARFWILTREPMRVGAAAETVQ